MQRSIHPGRRHAPTQNARSQRVEQGEEVLGYTSEDASVFALQSSDVGIIRDLAPIGTHLRPGDVFALREALGQCVALTVPAGVQGHVVASIVKQDKQGRVRIPTQYDAPLLVLNASFVAHELGATASATQQSGAGQVLPSPSSGRFYRRPAPDRPAFVEVGQVLENGKTVGLLEIMKTFTRIQYGGPGLPEKVKVTELIANDDDELSSGDPILRFEPI